MSSATQAIKSMKLYTHIERVHRELAEMGIAQDSPLSVAELSAFDQLHYHGTDALDTAISMLGIDAQSSVLEIGSGIGGPARYLAATTGARVTALELQPDQNTQAAGLTARCGLSDNVEHICGDFLLQEWGDRKFDAVVSWLALYHIPERDNLLSRCFNLINPGGHFFTEDLYCRAPFDDSERAEIASGLYGNYLPDIGTYQDEVRRAGFSLRQVDDMTADWKAFTDDRLTTYRADRERHVRVHGEATVDGLDEFYGLVCRHFSTGKLGGVRLWADKP